MELKRSSPLGASPERIDAIVDLYITWREKSAAVEAAYRVWQTAPARERDRAFGTYSAALDREQLAAGAYQRLLEQTEREALQSPA